MRSDESGEEVLLLDAHAEFVRRIDDASRVGYSVLGMSVIVVVVLVPIASGVPLVSLTAVAIAAGTFVVAAILGRIFGLGYQDARLRARVRDHCRSESIELELLVEEASMSDRFTFFTKLFRRS
jgi:chorismate synthase